MATTTGPPPDPRNETERAEGKGTTEPEQERQPPAEVAPGANDLSTFLRGLGSGLQQEDIASMTSIVELLSANRDIRRTLGGTPTPSGLATLRNRRASRSPEREARRGPEEEGQGQAHRSRSPVEHRRLPEYREVRNEPYWSLPAVQSTTTENRIAEEVPRPALSARPDARVDFYRPESHSRPEEASQDRDLGDWQDMPVLEPVSHGYPRQSIIYDSPGSPDHGVFRPRSVTTQMGLDQQVLHQVGTA